ncbi:MAG: hypothetical protein AAGE18_06870 [Pseudomonadota bacterium]
MPEQPPPDLATAEVLGHLGAFLPADTPGLPVNQLGLVATEVRTLALGHRRGSAYRAGQPVAALTGLILNATARIELWGTSPDDVETAMDAVQSNLQNAAGNLRALGFLAFSAEEVTPARHESSIPAWRKHGDFALRYEFQAEDGDDADSFIVRIPVSGTSDGETIEETTVVDAMRRWDEEAAPTLTLRGSSRRAVRLTALSLFDFRPGGFVGDGVTVERTVTGLTTPPTIYPTLADFLTATADPEAPDRNARISFPSIPDFLSALPVEGLPIPLGDWNEDAVRDLFQPHRLRFALPIALPTPRDVFTIRYAQPAFAAPAIVYLRVHTIPMNSG